ncbi:MAG: DinB family protein [Planctomycetota bacterium]|nr:DinB family protein [Planctomycetota bacterium]
MGLIGHFRRMLAYEAWANELAVASIESVPQANRRGEAWERLVGLLPHVALARQVWMWRIRRTPYQNPLDWFPGLTPQETRARLAEVDASWGAYIAGLREEDLEQECLYTSSEGVTYVSTVGEILTHVLNHSTYHRGQVARLVRECGGQRASTDFILMSRRAR